MSHEEETGAGATEDGSIEVIVLGGGYGGVMAANRLAGAGRSLRVTLVSDRDDLVHRVRLHEALAGRPLRRYPLRQLLHPGVSIVRGRAARIDAAEKRVVLATGQNLSYRFLIVAVGSCMDACIPGAAEHAGWLASPESARAGAKRLRELSPGSPVVVVGGGLTAIETATEIAEAHPTLAVTMLCRELGHRLSLRGRMYVEQALADLGIVVRSGEADVIDERGVVLAESGWVPSAMTVWAAGFSPGGLDIVTDLERDVRGRLLVKPDLGASGESDVFVVGDAAAPPPGIEFLRMSCATAMPMGAHAADAVVSKVRERRADDFHFGYRGICVSLGRRRGLLQFVDFHDRPIERVITGRVAAVLKELICRYVIGALRIERRWSGAYIWPRDAPALPTSYNPILPTGRG